MERPILASEQVYGGLNLEWEEEKEEDTTSSWLQQASDNFTFHLPKCIYKFFCI
jgi:hypothetical protein